MLWSTKASGWLLPVVFTGTIVPAIIFFATPVWESFYYRKSLHISVLSETLLINDDAIQSGLELSYRGVKISSPYRVEILLRNDGLDPIINEEFEKPIGIIFPRGTNILDYSIARMKPDNIAARVDVGSESNIGIVDIGLFNAGDEIVVIFIVSGYQIGKAKVDGRIAGVSDVHLQHVAERNDVDRSYEFQIVTYCIVLLFFVFSTIAIIFKIISVRTLNRQISLRNFDHMSQEDLILFLRNNGHLIEISEEIVKDMIRVLEFEIKGRIEKRDQESGGDIREFVIGRLQYYSKFWNPKLQTIPMILVFLASTYSSFYQTMRLLF